MGRRGGPWVSVSSLPQSKSGTSPAPGANFCLCLSCLPMNWGPDAGLTACTSRCRNRLSGSRDSASGRPCTLGPRGQQVALQARSRGAAGVPVGPARWDPRWSRARGWRPWRGAQSERPGGAIGRRPEAEGGARGPLRRSPRVLSILLSPDAMLQRAGGPRPKVRTRISPAGLCGASATSFLPRGLGVRLGPGIPACPPG